MESEWKPTPYFQNLPSPKNECPAPKKTRRQKTHSEPPLPPKKNKHTSKKTTRTPPPKEKKTSGTSPPKTQKKRAERPVVTLGAKPDPRRRAPAEGFGAAAANSPSPPPNARGSSQAWRPGGQGVSRVSIQVSSICRPSSCSFEVLPTLQGDR